MMTRFRCGTHSPHPLMTVCVGSLLQSARCGFYSCVEIDLLQNLYSYPPYENGKALQLADRIIHNIVEDQCKRLAPISYR
jgi:hypothetical protein